MHKFLGLLFSKDFLWGEFIKCFNPVKNKSIFLLFSLSSSPSYDSSRYGRSNYRSSQITLDSFVKKNGKQFQSVLTCVPGDTDSGIPHGIFSENITGILIQEFH